MNVDDLRVSMPARLVEGKWQITGEMPETFDYAMLDRLEQTDLPSGVSGRLDHSFYLHHYASLLPEDAVIIEIGTRDGVSAICMAWALWRRGGRVLTIDPGLVPGGALAGSCREFIQGDIERVRRNIKTAGVAHRVTPVPGTSADVLAHWTGEPVAMLFVDGAHTREDVAIDCGWMKYVMHGGIAVFDDWIAPVESAVREHIAANRDWEIVTESTRQAPGCPWKTVLLRR